MKKMKLAIAGLLLGVGLMVAPFASVTSASVASELKDGANSTTKADADGKRGPTLQEQIQNVTNVLLFIIGAVAVIVIIFAGIKFTTADGDASKIKSARDTILYAVVGVIIAIIAYAIVYWVVGSFTSS